MNENDGKLFTKKNNLFDFNTIKKEKNKNMYHCVDDTYKVLYDLYFFQYGTNKEPTYMNKPSPLRL